MFDVLLTCARGREVWKSDQYVGYEQLCSLKRSA